MPMRQNPGQVRHLILVLGDQLDLDSTAFDHFDRQSDVVWMAEVPDESTHVWSHKARIVLFLSAMRHFRDQLSRQGYCLHYRRIEDKENKGSLASELAEAIHRLKPKKLILAQPGDYRVLESIKQVVDSFAIAMELREDRHFFSSPEEFSSFARSRKQLRLEHFYQQLRRKFDVLMDGDKPVGGKWNYDAENRGCFGKNGPGLLPQPITFAPDALTQEAIRLVTNYFPNHPGNLAHFDWPVTSEQSEIALEDFLTHRLDRFGDYQDAMWTGQTWLYHSRLSAAMNLKLLNPRRVIARAEEEYRRGRASLSSVEGFIRQILGWREYVRGIYWHYMPAYAQRNALDAHEPLPDFYWTAKTEMKCLHQCLSQTLEYGYAHHIQRLMVTGLYSLLLGVEPKFIHEWYLAAYVDAVEWVELPNTIGMSQYADGGMMASKPYVATGKYIQRMSNYCGGCQYDPGRATGERGCPFTTLYWDFLIRHRESLSANVRMKLQIRNLDKLSDSEQKAIQFQASQHRERVRQGEPV